MVDRDMLEHSLRMTEETSTYPVSRLEFAADYIFDFTTYSKEFSELFAAKALEVCAAISERSTFDYIKDPDNHRWFLLMVNMPFFAKRLDWGTSIRGAWWAHDEQTLESCGLWRGDEQALSLRFTSTQWLQFVADLCEFAKAN